MLVPNEIIVQMRLAGITPPEPLVPDEKIHRFPIDSNDKKSSGWYRGYRNVTQSGEDFFVFIFGDWREGIIHKAISGAKLDTHDKKRVDEQIRKAQKAAEKEKKAVQDETAKAAQERWETLSPHFGKNEYLEKKGITELYGAKIDGFNLVVPMRNAEGEIRNLETINVMGKKGMYGGERTGLFHQIGEPREVAYICEGFSTAVAVHKCMGDSAFVAFNSGNIVPVAQAVAKKFPEKRIVVCGDNDRWPSVRTGEVDNVGAQKAEEAANLVGGKFVVPSFSDDYADRRPTDFDDLLRLLGPDEVRKQILSIEPSREIETVSREFVIHHPYPDENPKTFARKGTLANFAELMRRLRIIIRYNEISKRQEILIPNTSFSIDNRGNASLAYLLDWCERVGIPTANMGSYITAMADANHYNPVAVWIDSKPWDGVSRLEEFYATIKSPHEEMKKKLIRKWMLSAVAAAFEPDGVSAHGVLVLQGKQYLGKTAWFKRLAPKDLGVIADGVFLKPDNPDSVYQVVTKWIVELGEIDATFRKADVAQLKAFLTKQRDELRRPYAKLESEFARRTVFFGSVNEIDFLKDQTGNRRFWTVQCDDIDFDHNIDMQQVWAEFKTIYISGERWVLSHDDMALLNEHNEDFREVSPIEEQIRVRYNWDSTAGFRELSASQVLEEIGYSKPTNADCRAAGAALRKLTQSRNVKGLTRFKIPSREFGQF